MSTGRPRKRRKYNRNSKHNLVQYFNKENIPNSNSTTNVQADNSNNNGRNHNINNDNHANKSTPNTPKSCNVPNINKTPNTKRLLRSDWRDINTYNEVVDVTRFNNLFATAQQQFNGNDHDECRKHNAIMYLQCYSKHRKVGRYYSFVCTHCKCVVSEDIMHPNITMTMNSKKYEMNQIDIRYARKCEELSIKHRRLKISQICLGLPLTSWYSYEKYVFSLR